MGLSKGKSKGWRDGRSWLIRLRITGLAKGLGRLMGLCPKQWEKPAQSQDELIGGTMSENREWWDRNTTLGVEQRFQARGTRWKLEEQEEN